MNGRPAPAATALARDCDSVAVEPALAFDDITIESCSASPTSATPETSIGVTADVRNASTEMAMADIVWAARDLPNGPIVARFNEVVVLGNDTQTIQTFFVPNETQSIIDTVGTDAAWSSVIEAVIVPGTVQPATSDSFGLSGVGTARPVVADGGCEPCATAEPMTVDSRLPGRGTLAVAGVGIGAGITARLLRR